MLRKGTKFPAPDHGGYKLATDLRLYDPIMVTTFTAYGGQPAPEINMPLPDWLGEALKREADKLNRSMADGVSPSSNPTE
jgi:hypothetical protein